MAETKRRTQVERSEATRAALLEAGRELFAEHGYAAVSTGQIVSRSGLTRGALYHHFGGKRELFKAVFEAIEAELVGRIPVDELDAGDPLGVLRTGADTVLDFSLESDVQQIALTDAQAVLGYEEWREVEERYGLGLLTAGPRRGDGGRPDRARPGRAAGPPAPRRSDHGRPLRRQGRGREAGPRRDGRGDPRPAGRPGGLGPERPMFGP